MNIKVLRKKSVMTIYKKKEEPIGTLFILAFIIIVLALLLTFSNADGLTAL